MSELNTNVTEHKLWFDGPNYTADAVIIDPETAQILLVMRKANGKWALPGGFIDPSDLSSSHAAAREAQEEAGVKLQTDAPVVFRGKVNDPRNTGNAWIETSAHLFKIPSATSTPKAGDDASEWDWKNLSELPELHASHRQIIECGLDYLNSEQLLDVAELPDSYQEIEGGYMQYDKWIAKKGDEKAFVKCSPKKSPRFDQLQQYIEKEAAIMSHLRRNSFRHIPKKSAIRSNKFVMDLLSPEDGWQWRIDPTVMDTYIHDALVAFSELETTPIPPDVFAVEDSFKSILKEGWQSFDEKTHQAAIQRFLGMLPQLACQSQEIAAALIEDIPQLLNAAQVIPKPERLVFCHHDIRQSNFAWHPEKGVKIVDWSWAGPGLPGTDSTGLLIDLHKYGYNLRSYSDYINQEQCLNMIGFWLRRCTMPNYGTSSLREQQFLSAVSAYELLEMVSVQK